VCVCVCVSWQAHYTTFTDIQPVTIIPHVPKSRAQHGESRTTIDSSSVSCLHFPANIYHIPHPSTDEIIGPFKRLLMSLRAPFSSALYRVFGKKVVVIYKQMPELSRHSLKSSRTTFDFPLSQCIIHRIFISLSQ
jgi:hypothetical protein